jgi:tetratricopeptide (TPR) repeat protein
VTGGAGTSPYVGDRPFASADAAGFFGRAAEISEVDYLWRRHRLTVLFGPSGAGLTSLLHAGLVPRAVPPFVEAFPVGRIAQGSSFPVAALPEHNPHTLALLSAWSPVEPPTRLARFTIVDFLRKRWRNSRPTDSYGRRPTLLCVIDQAEELVTGQVSGGLFRAAFIEQLAEALREIPELHVLFSVRRDYKGALVEGLAAGGCAVDAQFEIHPLAPAAALAAVREPMAAAHRSFAPGVAERIVADLSESGDQDDGSQVAPPLLQGACARLWRAVPESVREITELDLRRCGGVGQLLADYCDQVVATVSSDYDLPAEKLLAWLQEWFITGLGKRALVDEGRAETRGMPNAVLRALRDGHLLSAELHAGSRWFALQHDCLVAPVRQARERLRRMTAMLPVRQSSVDHLRVAERAMASGELALAQRQAALALLGPSGRDLRPAAAAESMLGNVLYGQRDMGAAETHYRASSALYEASQDTPMVAYLLAAIGRTLLSRGQYREAVDCLYGAVTRLPNDQVVQAQLGQALELIEMAG